MEKLEEKLLEVQKKKLLVEQGRISHLRFKNIGFSNWYIKDNDALFYDEFNNVFEIDLPKQKSTLVTYQELNQDLSISPLVSQVDFPITADNEVVFQGECDDTINCELIITEYKLNESINHTLNLNEKKTMAFSKDSKLRFSIRVQGYGKLNLVEVSIGEFNLWHLDDLKTDDGLVRITRKNWSMPQDRKISYDQEIDTFFLNNIESNLKLFYGKSQDSLLPVDIFQELDTDVIYTKFKGNKDITVSVNLLLSFSLSDGNTKEHVIPMNENYTIKIPKDASDYSLSMEVSGYGTFNIDNIILSGYNYWPPKSTLKESPLSLQENPDKVIELNTMNLENWEKYTPKLSFSNWGHEFISELRESQTLNIKYSNSNDYKPGKDKTYNVHPTVNASGHAKLTFVMVTQDFKGNKQVFHMDFNQIHFIHFPLATEKVEFYLKVEGNGSFKNCSVYIKESVEEITNEVNVSLSAQDWFNNYNAIELEDEPDRLIGMVNLANNKRYISYREVNNNFNLKPENNTIRIKRNYTYTFDVKGIYDSTMQIIPMVIGYNDTQKVEIKVLKLNGKTPVKFHSSVNSIRMVFRLAGKGNFEINKFTIREVPLKVQSLDPIFTNKFEVEELKLLPPKELKEIKMAVIFDEFTEASYTPECKLIKFGPNNWRETLYREQPDLLMVESAWKGNNGAWEKKIGNYGEENNKELFQLLDWCKENDIPTVFWNKEDPVHFERFIDIAKRFDLVFTTDENVVPRYQARMGHDNVFALPFAAQPKIHNPVKLYSTRVNKVCFAGSYYHHHEERSKDMDALLDGAAEYGLDIFDRNYEKTKNGLMPNHQFPARFQQHIKGNLKYYEIDKAYKGYKVNMNVNTVKASNTMFSRRVFESLACGTPIVSNNSIGINNIFGDLVTTSDNKDELKVAFDRLLNDSSYYKKISHLGIREVLTKHTYLNRLTMILEKLGLNTVVAKPEVTVLGIARSPEDFEEIITSFERQNYSDKKLYVLTEVYEGYLDYYKKYNNENVSTFIMDYVETNYSNIKELINSEFVAYFSSENYYGENYLNDMVLTTTYSNADFIGKNNYFQFNNDEFVEVNESMSFEYTTYVQPERSIIKVDSLTNISTKEILTMFEQNQKLDSFYALGKVLFSVDNLNFIENIKDVDGTILNKSIELIEI